MDDNRPPMTAIAIGARKAVSRPIPSAMGIIPASMASDVMMIGRARTIDEDEALDLLRQDVAVAERAVLRLISVPLT